MTCLSYIDNIEIICNWLILCILIEFNFEIVTKLLRYRISIVDLIIMGKKNQNYASESYQQAYIILPCSILIVTFYFPKN